MTNNIVQQKYWEEGYENLNLFIASPEDKIVKFILKYIENGEGKSVLEIGAYPGRYLAWFGIKGYILHGIDLTPKIIELSTWLKSLDYSIGEFINSDFLTYTFKTKYDIVFSAGFIEHFTNFIEIIDRQCELVKKQGLLIIIIPNFLGKIQYILHKFLDNENLKRHNLHAMDIKTIKKRLERNGYKIIFCGYFGNFEFWVDKEEKSYIKNKICDYIFKNQYKASNIYNNKLWSPYCCVIGKLL